MGWRIEIDAEDYSDLREHLRGDVEEVAFLLTRPYQGDRRLRVREVNLVPTSGFSFQSDYHVELADKVRPELIKRAWDLDACVIEAHSHLEGPAGFSVSDLWGFEEWVPHFRWRLGGRPYAALVFAPDAFDALVWGGEEPAEVVEAMDIIDGASLVPTGRTHRALARQKATARSAERGRYDR
jgi:hypothetical protein